MGIFGKKKQHGGETPLQQPLYGSSNGTASGSAQRTLPSTIRNSISRNSTTPDLALDWSKIYVEIDNDANVVGPSGTIESSETEGSRSYDETAEFGSEPSSSCATGLTPTFSNARSEERSGGSGELTRGGPDSVMDGLGTVAEDSPSPSNDMDDATRMTGMTGHDIRGAPSYEPTIRSNISSKDDSAANFTITNNGKYLTTNDFANAQLMRWKFAAEEGPTYIQILAFLASLSALISTLYPLVTNEAYWVIPTIICAVHTTVLCCIILIFEFRALGARNPMNVRARARALLTRYLNILRLLWGRGCLYIFTGSLNITIYFVPWCLYTGLTLIGLGVLAILVGSHASFNLERLKMSLTDHSFLWSKFEAADTDRDNLIDISEFSNLIWSLGLELDDAYTFRAFSQIDNDSDARINFREFKGWWIAVNDDDKKAAPLPRNIDV